MFPKQMFLFLLVLSCAQCAQNAENTAVTVKYADADPFRSGLPLSQYFEIDSRADQVLEGKNGTVLTLPDGCFVDASGAVYRQKVRVELAEALRLRDMIRANLTTTSDGKPLETDGMIYFNATTPAGEQLYINKKVPVFIEIPTRKKKAGMMAYRGVRDEAGNMNWVSPKPLNTYLVPVDIFSLDFLPEGFRAEVDRSVPFGKYQNSSAELADSLYYSFSVPGFSDLVKTFISTNYNEPYYNKHKKIIDGAYTEASYEQPDAGHAADGKSVEPPAIDPAMIKVIRSEQFQNTLLATREFEKRIQTIFKTCNNAVLEVYIKNLDKNLYELDQMAAALVQDEPNLHRAFLDFSAEGLTTVKDAGKHSAALRRYYSRQLKQVKAELEQNRKKLISALRAKSAEVEKVAGAYKQLLFQREKYRMETYGFVWTDTGWINIDTGALPKFWGLYPLEVVVSNGRNFDRVYTYAVFRSIKSIYRMNTSDNVNFYAGNEAAKKMLVPLRQPASIVAVAYKGETPALGILDFKPGVDTLLSFDIQIVTPEILDKKLTALDFGQKENSIAEDLGFMKIFYAEQQRQKKLLEEIEVMLNLWDAAFPCLLTKMGKPLFMQNCATCHDKNMTDNLTGPPLKGAESRWAGYPRKDLYTFIRNSQNMIAHRHPQALEIWNEYKPTVMSDFPHLTNRQIEAILAYVKSFDR
jgi:Cytochrome c